MRTRLSIGGPHQTRNEGVTSSIGWLAVRPGIVPQRYGATVARSNTQRGLFVTTDGAP